MSLQDESLVLAIDVGSQSVRAVLVNGDGDFVAKSSHALDPPKSPQPGYAEVDPEALWQTVCQTVRQLSDHHATEISAVVSMSITVQRGTVVCLDESGEPVRPAIMWMDQRISAGASTLPLRWRSLFRLSGQYATIDYLAQQCEARWLAENQPALWRGTASFLFLSGFLHYRLTAALRDSVANQVGYIPFDYKRHRWASAGNWKWQVVPVRASQLPELVAVGEAIGQLDDAAAQQMRLPTGLPVIAAASDKASESLGAGCLSPHQACLSLGTQASINVMSDRYIEAVPMIPAFPAPVPGRYCSEVTVIRGFWMVTWFKQQFAALEAMQAEQAGLSTEQILDRMVESIDPGSLGLMLQPFWGGGLRYPGISAKGAVIGFGADHTKAHFYRAILEGLAYALRDGRHRIERKSGAPVTECVVTGGGSRSDVTLQIIADVMNLPARRIHTHEASILGAAITAAVGGGLHDGFESAVAAMSHRGESFEPNLNAHHIYNRLFNEVYLKMYGKLEPLYETIRDITGYPA